MSKTYRPWNPDQGWLLPPSPRDWLSEGDLVYFMAVRVLRETAALMLTAPASRLPILYAAMIQHIAQGRLPPRKNRANPPVVKKKMSNFGRKRAEHYRVPQPQTTFRQSVVILK